MIFKQRMVDAILEGRKFETRRPANGACRYREGRAYAVQPGRGKKAVAYIRVWQLDREPLGAMRESDARAEGFANRGEFMAYWRALYGSAPADLVVDVIRFELIHPDDYLLWENCPSPSRRRGTASEREDA